MKRVLIGIAATAAVMLPASVVQAAILFDNSVDTAGFTSATNFSNKTGGQNFLARFTLSSDSNLNGLDIYSSSSGLALGNGVTIKIRADAAGQPDTANLFAYSSVVSAIDNDGSNNLASAKRIRASFTDTALSAGDYWIGMSGDVQLGWVGDRDLPANNWLLTHDNLVGPTSFNLAFRVIGDTVVGAVPEPTTWAFMIFGFGAIGGSLRSSRRRLSNVKTTFSCA